MYRGSIAIPSAKDDMTGGGFQHMDMHAITMAYVETQSSESNVDSLR